MFRDLQRIPRRDHHLPADDNPHIVYQVACRRRQQLAMWMRSGHSPLHADLHRHGLRPSSFCERCTMAPEDRQHFLFECPRFATERQTHIVPLLRRISADRGMPLLPSDVSVLDYVLHHEYIQDTVNYVMATGRFHCRA